MFSKSLIISLVSAAVFVAATPIEQRTNHINSPSNSVSNSCNVGTMQCCQSIHQTSSQSIQGLAGLLGVVIPADNLFAGIQCSPILNTIPILSGSNSCNAKPVCCTGETYNSGLLNVGCSPISLS